MLKKVLFAVCILAMCLLTLGCSSKSSSETIYGKVTAIDGNSVTVLLGVWEESSGSLEGSSPDGNKPEDGNEPTDSSTEGNPPGTPSGGKPEGDPPEKLEANEKGTAPPGGEGGAMPGNIEAMAPGRFTEGDESRTFNLEGATITVAYGPNNGDAKESGIDDIKIGFVLEIKPGYGDTAKSVTIVQGATGGGMPADGSGVSNQGSAATTISKDSTETKETYTSDGNDENALRVEGATVTLDDCTVEKIGGSSSNVEDGDFYGMNAALLATSGAQLTINGGKVESDAQNGNGVFSYGNGTVVNINGTEITTRSDNSGGIQTTGGATTNARNLTITTQGSSAAAIRSDRGGGTVNVEGGTYTSNGLNSPSIYSTADISVKDAKLAANQSEALVIEGGNSIALEGCKVVGNMSPKGASASENLHNVMIYQSMSGDAEQGTSKFDAKDCSLEGKSGDMFYVTNTKAEVSLENVALKLADKDANLFTISGNSASRGWGRAGKNGAQVELYCSNQKLEGAIEVDSISTLNMTLANGSSMKGSINIVANAQDGTANDAGVSLVIESGSTLTLTGDCTVSTLANSGTIDYNGHTITLADGTVMG